MCKLRLSHKSISENVISFFSLILFVSVHSSSGIMKTVENRMKKKFSSSNLIKIFSQIIKIFRFNWRKIPFEFNIFEFNIFCMYKLH